MLKLVRTVSLIVALLFVAVYFLSLLFVDPGNSAARLGIAEADYYRGDMDNAMLHARRAIWGAADNGDLLCNSLILQIKIAIGQGDAGSVAMFSDGAQPARYAQRNAYAGNCMKKLQQLQPASSTCYLERGKLRLIMGDYTGSLDDLSAGMANMDRRGRLYAGYLAIRGEAYWRAGQLHHAMVDINRAIALDADDPERFFVKSGILKEMGDHEGAVKQAEAGYALLVQRAVRRHPHIMERYGDNIMMMRTIVRPNYRKWVDYYMSLKDTHYKKWADYNKTHYND